MDISLFLPIVSVLAWAFGLLILWFIIRTAVLSALTAHARNEAAIRDRVAAVERAQAARASQ